ncbi:MAG: DUF4394 domain-containing protein [Cytophagales bacterium]|nr:DUF4394 domain-containing protein [Armatimonadota bacterium]
MIPSMLLGVTMFLLTASPVFAQTIYGLSGDALVRFDARTPGVVTTIGTPNAFLSTLSFRPSDGLLYGYETRFGDGPDVIYTIDTSTAAVTPVASSEPGTGTAHVGMDFEPDSDRLRVTSDIGENRTVSVENNLTVVEADLRYAAGDRFGGQFPLLIDIAFAPATTTLFGIDYLRNTLVRIESASSGALTTVGALGVNTDFLTGFAITSGSDGTSTAYAALNPSFDPRTPSRLFTIDLVTGAATAIGAIGGESVYSIAVALPPASVAAPEPSTAALLFFGVGIGMTGLTRRRRSH